MNIASRIVKEHGLISNVLPGLDLTGITILSTLCRRTYKITVPHNTPIIELVRQFPDKIVFPKIDDLTEGFICKSAVAEIDGLEGHFYGSFDSVTE